MAQLSSTPRPTITMVTLSFEGDFSLCRLLCETVDRFVPPEIQHLVVVPFADLKLFGTLADPRRRIIAEESLLPKWLHKIPMPSRTWRKRLLLPRRNVYLSTKGWPVRGWIAQQIMKLCAAATVEADVIVNVDSDTVFVRPFEVGRLWTNGKLRLTRVPDAGDLPTHRNWHMAASNLLGLKATSYHGADYIDNLVTWRALTVRRLLDHIAQIGEADALQLLAGTADFSEYILYGVYCDKVIGLDAAGHYADPASLCETVWSLPNAGGRESPVLAFEGDRVAIGIQSTIRLSEEERRMIVARVIAASAAPHQLIAHSAG